MHRRDFLKWFRSAPVALPAVAASAVAGGSEARGGALYLDGRKVMELRGECLVTGYDLETTIYKPGMPWSDEEKMLYEMAKQSEQIRS